MKLSEHFTLEEMTKRKNLALDNTPTGEALENMKRVCRWLEMLRSEWNKRYGDGGAPIIINSGYRSPAVNKAAGGVATSNHLTGCAVDIRVSGKKQLLRYAVILLDISDEAQEPFDELLIEQEDGKLWLHFAVRPTANRGKIKL